jgi:hypothetical protein
MPAYAGFLRIYRLMVTFTIDIGTGRLIPLFLLISFESRILLIFLWGYFAFCYSVPLFTIGDHKFGLRHVPGLKPFLITLVWTLSCCTIACTRSSGPMHLTDINMRDTTILMIAKRFLFIGALTIPFDIRDLF